MRKADHRALRSKLDAFSRRLEARIREFKDRGEFSDTHSAFTEGIRKRHDTIKAKLDSAVDRGATWDLIKYEFERDFNALSEEFTQWERHLDATAMRGEATKHHD